MKVIISVTIALFVATCTFAVIDPDPDSMGLYFDESAEIYCVDEVAMYEVVTMHLMLTGSTHDYIFGFEAGYDITGNAQVVNTLFYDPLYCPVGSPDNMIVGFSYPYPTFEATILATILVMNLSTENDVIEFYLHGTTPSSIDPEFPTLLLAGGIIQVAGISVEEGPTAQINGGCAVVPTNTIRFDMLKSLYRDATR